MIGYCRTLTIRFEGGFERHYFGIDIMDETGEVLSSAPAITANWRLITRYVLLMNQLELSPVHFWDVVEDLREEAIEGR